MWDEIPYVNSQPAGDAGSQSPASSTPASLADKATDLLSQYLSYHAAQETAANNVKLQNAGANVLQLQGAQPAPGAWSTGKILLIGLGLVAAVFVVRKLA